jgi:selenocysteine lyase/cysteine desulfurase
VTRPPADALAAFVRGFPEYETTARLDELRRSEYGRLDETGQVYLDYTGASLPAIGQIRAHLALLSGGVYGNPHSGSPASMASTDLVEATRREVLDWFNAANDYIVAFTPNATGAIKLVAEAFPFGPGGRLLLTADNHNSVNGVREYAGARGAAVDYAPLKVPELRLDAGGLAFRLKEGAPEDAPRLFAFPAQSNFSGVKHPLELIGDAQAQGWRVLLDAASYVPTNRLDLARVRPDFVSISFYKMFGYPTGVGALLVRRDAVDVLERPWFAGGTVNFATVGGRAHLLAQGEAGFEDGTINFLSIPAVRIGLRHLAAAGIDVIERRVRSLTGWLLRELLQMTHANGRPLVRIYGPVSTTMRGGVVTMNFYDPDGHLLDYRRVEELAAERRISLRTGCFCNPGVGEAAEGISEDDIAAAMAATPELSLPRFLQFITHRNGKSAGSIRVSFGIASTFADAWAFREFAAGLRDQTNITIGEVTFDIGSCRVIRDGS